MDLTKETITSLSKKISEKEISVEEITEFYLDRITKLNPELNSIIFQNKNALEQAKELDAKIQNGEEIGKLAGIPFTVKDAFCIDGVRSQTSSKILDQFTPPYTATSVQKVLDQNGILLGKTNNDPFGFGSSTENSDFGVSKNPWDNSRTAGGSSGGSAAAVSANLGLFSIAEDTGGSIRQPANFCGVVGMKPTYGRVSRYGAISYASSLDTVGPITKTVEDNAIVLEIIAGKDKMDGTTLENPVENYTEEMKKGVSGLKIGFPKEYFNENVDSEVKEKISDSLKKLENLGAKIIEISLPNTDLAISTYYTLATSEASSNLGRFDGIRYGLQIENDSYAELMKSTRGEGLNPEAKRRVMLGSFLTSAGYSAKFYKTAQKIRTLLIRDFDKAFEKVDAFISPVSPSTAFKFGENTDDPMKMWLEDVFTVTLNPTGSPGLSIPAGLSKNNLPIGMQIIGPKFSESTLYRIGYAYEKEFSGYENLSPKL